MEPDYGLLALCGAIFLMMIVLNILKHRTRKSGLDSYVRRQLGRTRRMVPREAITPPPPVEPPDEPEA